MLERILDWYASIYGQEAIDYACDVFGIGFLGEIYFSEDSDYLQILLRNCSKALFLAGK